MIESSFLCYYTCIVTEIQQCVGFVTLIFKEEIIMDILEDVRKVTEGGINGGSVVTIIAITLIAAVVFICLGSVCLVGLRKLFHKYFDKNK